MRHRKCWTFTKFIRGRGIQRAQMPPGPRYRHRGISTCQTTQGQEFAKDTAIRVGRASLWKYASFYLEGKTNWCKLLFEGSEKTGMEQGCVSVSKKYVCTKATNLKEADDQRPQRCHHASFEVVLQGQICMQALYEISLSLQSHSISCSVPQKAASVWLL